MYMWINIFTCIWKKWLTGKNLILHKDLLVPDKWTSVHLKHCMAWMYLFRWLLKLQRCCFAFVGYAFQLSTNINFTEGDRKNLFIRDEKLVSSEHKFCNYYVCMYKTVSSFLKTATKTCLYDMKRGGLRTQFVLSFIFMYHHKDNYAISKYPKCV